MNFQDVSRRRLLVSVGLAAWSWLVVSVLTAAVVLAGGRRLPGAAVPSLWSLAVRFARFDVGQSVVVAPDRSALSVVLRGGAWPLVVLVLAVVFAGALTALAIWLGRQGYGRAVGVVGLVGAIPAPLVAFWFVVSGVVPMPSPATGVGVGAVGAALALAVPLAGFGARIVNRDSRSESGAVVLEAWLVGNWFVGGLAAVLTATGAPSLGRFVVAGWANGDLSVFAAAVLVLAAPLVFASIVRETLWVTRDIEPRGAFPAPSGRTATIGLVLLLVALLGGAGASVMGPGGRSGSLAAVVPDVLFQVSVAVVVASVVALAAGIVLGRMTVAVGQGWAGLLLDGATNVPMLVLAVVVLTWGGTVGGLDGWTIGLVAGLAAAPMVGRRTTLTFEQEYGVAETIPVGASVACLGGALSGFLLVDVAVLRLGLPTVGLTLLQIGRGPVWAVAILLSTTLPILGALLLSEGIRPKE